MCITLKMLVFSFIVDTSDGYYLFQVPFLEFIFNVGNRKGRYQMSFQDCFIYLKSILLASFLYLDCYSELHKILTILQWMDNYFT